jgi:hypothetical protein
MTTSRATSNVRGFKNRSSIRTGSASEVLAKIFARLVIESGSDMPDKWARLMHDYIYDRRNAIPLNRKDQSSARGNLTKELTKDQMSFNVFFKGMRFLDFESCEIIINAKNRKGKVFSVKEEIGFGDRIDISHLAPQVQNPESSIFEDKTKHEEEIEDYLSDVIVHLEGMDDVDGEITVVAKLGANKEMVIKEKLNGVP